MRKLTLSLAVMAALLPLRGYSLGLGELELHSALNQELNAEIEVLSASPEDAEQILIKLASREAFNRAGIDRPFVLQQIKFKIVAKGGVPYVQVYSKTPMREPFLSFLLEIDWPQGHLLREYTLLLDPPIYNTTSTSSAATAAASDNVPFDEPVENQAQAQPVYAEQGAPSGSVQTGVIASESGRSVNYQYQTLPSAAPSAGQYRVQRNDTLWSIANRMRPDSSVSVEQMMMALVRKNPEAFIRENINGVKRGFILRAPSREDINALDRQQAVAQAREHSALWREYSQSAASSSPASSMEADEMNGSAAEQPRDADGHLSIVGASDSGSEHAGSNQDPNAELAKLKQELAMANEQLESAKLEKENLRSRLAELEQRVQTVIANNGSDRAEMDDADLAKLQQDLQSTSQAAEPAEAMPVDEMAEEEAMSEEAAADDMIAEEEMPEEGVSEELMDEEMPEAGMDEDAAIEPAGDALFADEAAGDEPVANAPINTQLQSVQTVETPAFAQEKPQGFVANLMNDPKLLGMVGGGLAFILLLLALLLKRLRGSKAEEDEWTAAMDDMPSDLSDIDANIDTATEDPTVVRNVEPDMNSTTEMMAEPIDDELLSDELEGVNDTQIDDPEMTGENLEDTVFSLDDAPDAAGAGDDADRDDVIAETDVYLAYGIYQQAEELLINAIDQNPERDDYRMKLLETHYAAKNVQGFETLAEEVKSRKANDKAYWGRVVAMGMELNPENDLFSGVMADFDPNELLPDIPQAADVDLDAGDSGEADFDLGLDDTESADDEMDLSADLDDIADEITEDELAGDDTSSDLEFDLGELDDDAETLDVASEEPTEAAAEMDIDDDFSLDFDAADLGFEESETDDADEMSLDADLDLSDDLSDSGEIDLSGELGELDDDLDVGDLGAADLDASDDDLDLGDMDLSDASLDASDDGEFDISELSEDVDEVSTKLDLAKAYIDMGDNDGARSILEEVKTEGNDEQQQQAEALMQQAS
ncbi:hypothetical protein MNBD_GAMMA08-1635 [hydrothermal vent metagenome]|uniref:FimV N-terminal domain-containing protein n=1 Tax=hydrothermal vent metagenome TaxID=652676 RepID=A0A3B0XQ36_9ZZZZ